MSALANVKLRMILFTSSVNVNTKKSMKSQLKTVLFTMKKTNF